MPKKAQALPTTTETQIGQSRTQFSNAYRRMRYDRACWLWHRYQKHRKEGGVNIKAVAAEARAWGVYSNRATVKQVQYMVLGAFYRIADANDHTSFTSKEAYIKNFWL